jgi:hypothetical protein
MLWGIKCTFLKKEKSEQQDGRKAGTVHVAEEGGLSGKQER